MKRLSATLTVLFLLTFLFISSGSSGAFSLTVCKDGETVFGDNYDVPLATRIKVLTEYRGSYYDYYSDVGADVALNSLNADLQADLLNLFSEYEKPPVDASVKFVDGVFNYTEEKDGTTVAREAFYGNLFATFGKRVSLNVHTETARPKVTLKLLKEVTKERSRFATSYEKSSAARKHNVKLATGFLNGYELYGGEQLSYNAVVGARTKERGFLNAGIIENGKFSSGIGGGVCQVSTTLYNAAIRAGLEVITVNRHSLPVSYVPLSFDAMVSEYSDLVIKNPTEYPVYISSYADGERLEFIVYGAEIYKNLTVKAVSKTVEVLNPSGYDELPDDGRLLEGEVSRVISEPKCGYVSEGYLEFYRDGVKVKTTRLRRDVYRPQNGIILRKNIKER